MPARTNAVRSSQDWEQLRTFSSITLLGLLVFFVIRLANGKLTSFGAIPIALIPATLSTALAWKQRFYRTSANLVILAAMIAVGCSHPVDGGINSPSLWVICVVPVAGGLLLGPLAMLVHTLVAALMITVAWQGSLMGLSYPQQIELGPIDWIILRVLSIVVVSLVGLKIVRDTEKHITQIARQRALVQASHRAARSFDEEKSQFLDQMVQEIRAPMQLIKKVAQQWVKKGLDPELRESVNVMDRCADHLMTMMLDIQDLSKIDNGEVRTLKERFLVNSAVQDVALIFEAKAKDKGLALEVTGPETETWAIGDGQRLVQVLSNLMANAIKFSDAGTITLAWDLDDQGQASFTVTDQGIGMTPSQVDSLFQKYAQVDLDEGVSRGGTGLGLTISKALSEAMDGELSVQSTHGEGTSFRLDLPLPPDEPDPKDEAA